MKINKIYNEDCFNTMKERIDTGSIDCILTSPPYNTSRSNCDFFNDTSKGRYTNRYVDFNDMKSDGEYMEWTLSLFMMFDRILKKGGVVLYNINYGKNTHDSFYTLISEITLKTPFTVADTICWKKHTAVPNCASPNKLTRIWEPVFVFVRKEEYNDFSTNKRVVSTSKRTGQKNYENIHNFIDAPNNDGSTKIHKATYSTSLCKQLLKIYCKQQSTVYDPFMGTGTTAAACVELGLNYIGSEIYEPYYRLCLDKINMKR